MSFGEFDEGFGEFVDFESESLSGDPVTVWAEMAVHFAEIRKHDLHEVGESAVGEPGAVDAGHRVVARIVVGSAFFDRDSLLIGGRKEDVVGGHLAELRHFGPAVGTGFDEHGKSSVSGGFRIPQWDVDSLSVLYRIAQMYRALWCDDRYVQNRVVTYVLMQARLRATRGCASSGS